MDMKHSKRIVRPLVVTLLVAGVMGMTGCEQFFTSSLLSSLRRDPASMSSEQKITFAQQALSSGDPAAMKQAFDALVGTGTGSGLTTSEKVLAVQLGVGASNIQSMATQVAAQYVAGQDSTATINAAASGINASLVAQTSAILGTLPASSGATADDYALVAISLGLVAANTAGGVQNLNGTEPDVVQAKTYFDTSKAMLQASGQSSDTVNGIAALFNA